MIDLTDNKRYREDWRHRIIISVDLGKRQDFTAITVSEARAETRTNAKGEHFEVMGVDVRNIERLPLGTDYETVARRVYDVYYDERLLLIDQNEKRPVRPVLLVDAGGVGDAVADIMRKVMGLPHVRYRLVAGTATTRRISKLDFTVPRSHVFQMLDAAFNSGRIRIDPRLKLARALTEELKNLRVQMSEETGYVRVVHRERSEHDDLSICLASTNWYANLRRPGTSVARALYPDGTDERGRDKIVGIRLRAGGLRAISPRSYGA